MTGDTIVLATGNKGKLAEFSQLFVTHDIKIIPQAQFDIQDVEETGTTFIENAIIKARHASAISNLPAIADDSGLVVDALNGDPGIFSARYAGEHGNNAANNQKLLANMKGINERSAFFVCVLVFMRHALDPFPIISQAFWQGEIARQLSGSKGFGYDPLFFLSDYNCTAAELDSQVKNQISHRAQALQKLANQIFL